MKKQLILITGLLALTTAAFAAENTALPLNTLAKDIEDITNESIVIKTKDTGLLPLTAASDFKELIDANFKKLTKNELLNIQAASLALHDAYKNASEKLENLLTSKIAIRKTTVDNLIKVLVKLYKGESYADAVKGQVPGFVEGPAGTLLALVANAANLVQNLHAHFTEIKVLPEVVIPANIQHGGIITSAPKTLLPAIKITEGTSFIAQNEKAKHFIAYAIGRLVIYKSELVNILPVKTTKGTSFGGSTKSTRAIKTTEGTTIIK
jgi:hypothetical protein